MVTITYFSSPYLLFFHAGKQSGRDVASDRGRAVSLDQVNKMDQTEFVRVFAPLFNDQVWPLEQAWQARPFRDVQHLRDAIQEAVLTADSGQQRQLIANYPDMAELILAVEGVEEQISQDNGSLALEQMDDSEQEQLREVARRYREKFDLPFVACLGTITSREQIIEQGVRRLENSAAQERVVALSEVVEIANDRFAAMLADANPIRSAWARKFEQLN